MRINLPGKDIALHSRLQFLPCCNHLLYLAITTVIAFLPQTGLCKNWSLPSIISQPSGSSLCAGSPVIISSSAVGDPLPSVTWQRSNDGISWVNINSSTDGGIYSGFQSEDLSVASVPYSVNGFRYRAMFTNADGTVYSNAATLVVSEPASITLFKYNNTPVCTNSGIISVSLNGSGKFDDGKFTATPAGISIDAVTGEIDPSKSSGGTFNINYTSPANGECPAATATTTVTLVEATKGGTLEPVVSTVCPNSNSGTISLTGHVGAVLRWEYSINGGSTWATVPGTSPTLVYSNIPATRLYRAVVQNGICGPAYSSGAVVSVIPPFPPSPVIASPASICPGESSILSASSGYPVNGINDGSGTFQTANPKGWCRDGDCQGNFLPANGDNTDNGVWRETNPHPFNGIKYSSPDPKFAIASGSFNSVLETPVFSLLGQTNGLLNFLQGYILNAGASAKIEISTNGGTSYNAILEQHTGPDTLGYSTGAVTMKPSSLDLRNYIGLSNLRIRFSYAGSVKSAWVIDNVIVPSQGLDLVYKWAAPETLNTTDGPSVIATPSATTTYTVTTIVGGCPGGTKQVTVNVKPNLITSATVPEQTVCSGSPISNINFSSNLPSTTYKWYRDNIIVTGIGDSGTSAISGSLINTTSAPQTVNFTVIPSAPNSCLATPFSAKVIVNPNFGLSISGNQSICGNGKATITLSGTGPFPVDINLSDGSSLTMTGSPMNVLVSPSSTTTYTIISPSVPGCAGGGISGSAKVTVINTNAPVGTWLCGSGDGDWFNPCNWGGGFVPDNNTNVIIASSAGCSAIIDTSSVFAPADRIARSRNLAIEQGKNVSFAPGKAGELEIAGNWVNNEGPGGFTANTGTVEFMGNTAQSVKTLGNNSEAFYNLIVNNSSGNLKGLTLQSAVTVSNKLTLENGIVNSSSKPANLPANGLGLLTLKSSAGPIEGNPGPDAFINGQMAREFVTAGPSSEYFYPLGKVDNANTVYRPMSVQAVNAQGLSTFTAEYFPIIYPGPTVLLGQLAGFVPEYWEVNRSGANTIARVNIPYTDPGENNWIGNDNSPDLTPCEDCNVAIIQKKPNSSGWDFTKPEGQFNSIDPEYRHYSNPGPIYSAALPSFGAFTHGFSYGIVLPVQVISFTGRMLNGVPVLEWKINDAEDLEGFDIEFSYDGSTYSTIASVPNNQAIFYRYTDKDRKLPRYYYRLAVKQSDGKVLYSNIVVIEGGEIITRFSHLFPNPAFSDVFLEVESAGRQSLRGKVLDITGKYLFEFTRELSVGKNKVVFNINGLAAGNYLVEVSTSGRSKTMQLVKH